MAQGKILFDSTKDLDLPNIGTFIKTPSQERYENFSASNQYEAITLREWDEVSITARNLTETEMRNAFNWWSWARLGNRFSFALISTQNSSCKLDAAASSDQTTISLSTAMNLAANDWCIIKGSTIDDYEVFQISSIDGSDNLTATTNLRHSYATSAVVRNVDFWPNMICKNRSFPMEKTLAGHYNLAIDMVEIST